MIDCPDCGSKAAVIESRRTKDSMRRRRQCKACGRRFTTYEVLRLSELMVADQMARAARELDCLADILWGAVWTGDRIVLMMECERLAEALRREAR